MIPLILGLTVTIISLILVLVIVMAPISGGRAGPFVKEGFSEPTEVHSRDGVLRATIIASEQEGKVANQSFTAMVYNGSLVGPTLRANPGDRIELTLINKLAMPTNLHFHGLHVSPSGSSDNVFREVGPGEIANYIIDIPADHPPGTFWYHSHQHHLSYDQVSAGMSGLIVIEGLVDLLPESLHDIEEREIAMKDFQISSDPMAASQRTINGDINPTLKIAPGETQLWRLANIGSETFYNIVLPNHTFRVIAEDGVPVWDVWDANQLLLPSGKRYDVLVTSRAVGTYPLTALSYHQGCVVCPVVTLLTLNVEGQPVAAAAGKEEEEAMPTSLLPRRDLEDVKIDNQRELIFSSNDEEGKYMIDGRVFDPNRVDQQIKLGTVEEWKLKNSDDDEHPFHIHVNDFQVISVNYQPYIAHGLQDTVVIPGHGEVVIRIPFKDFVGKSVYHCHIMFHEDGGMMGVVEVIK